MKIEIKHRFNGSILFTGKFGSLKLAVIAAISSEADLRGADLGGANLYGADLGGANLYEADLRGADLRGANLYGADLGGANLYEADLRGADLRGADLRGANLYGATEIISLGFPGGWPAHAWLREKQLSIRVGCREFWYEEALKYWQGKPDRLEQLAATEYARQIALVRGWKV